MTERQKQRPSDEALVEEFRRLYALGDDGRLRWRIDQRGTKAGKEAGGSDGSGYLSLQILGQRFKAHRIMWLMHYGYYPDGNIDHINGDRLDNRIENLRIATQAQNVHNRIRAGKYPTGVYKGPRGRYVARIQAPGEKSKIYLGYYDTPELAAAAYAGASIILHGEFAAKLSRETMAA